MRIRIVPQGAVIFPGEPGGSGKYKEKMDKYVKIRRFRLTEDKYGGSRGALEERLTKWLAQALEGFSYLNLFVFSFLSFFIHAVLGKSIQVLNVRLTHLTIQAASWSLGMWWRRSLPRYIGLELLIYIVLYYTLQLVYRLSTIRESGFVYCMLHPYRLFPYEFLITISSNQAPYFNQQKCQGPARRRSETAICGYCDLF